jgi:hypothetical protein
MVCFLVVCCFVAAFAMDYLVFDLHTLVAADQGIPVAMESGRAHTRLDDISLAAIIVGSITAALWLAWQYRAHANLRRLGAEGMRFTPAVAVVAWLIPGVNLIVPFLALRELWRASDPEAGPQAWRATPTSPVVFLWWVGWLGGVLLAFAGLAIGQQANPTEHTFIVRDTYLTIASGIAIATAVVAIVLIRRVEDRQLVKSNTPSAKESWSSWHRS